MGHSYNYAVLQAVPDPRRGERVNIGLVVFLVAGLDVRICETRKLTALTARSWDADIKTFGEVLQEIDDPELEAKPRNELLRSVQDTLVLSQNGWFEAKNENEYESVVRDIMRTLVSRPKRQRRREAATVVSEISSVLRQADLLASKDDNLDSGLVVRDYPVSQGLEADFVQLNSQFHVAAVLDLRANNPQIAQAALKAVVLDQAALKFTDRKVHRVGIYAAATSRIPELRDNLAILKPYADDVMNWEDAHDREQVRRLFFDAYNSHVAHIN